MLKTLKLKNYRNFDNINFCFQENKNFIIWNNWTWKTNILEAISLIYQKNLINKEISNFVKKEEKYTYIEMEKEDWKKFSISIDKDNNKKIVSINWKSTTKNKCNDLLEKIIVFQPMDMNMMYLSPTLRRDFLDDILWNTYPQYNKINKDYKNALKNRNKLLKNIKEWKARKEEIIFWDNILIKNAVEIYKYRKEINDYFSENIYILKEMLNFKINDIKYNYITKVDLNNVEQSLNQYITKNLDRDIIIWNTPIWPHIDDFDILLDNFSLVNFASRWETKSIILWLKIIETKFIKKITNKEIIFLIDDLFSELDETHETLLLKEFSNSQIIITAIETKQSYNNCTNIIYL